MARFVIRTDTGHVDGARLGGLIGSNGWGGGCVYAAESPRLARWLS
jgi:hypothetical protein